MSNPDMGGDFFEGLFGDLLKLLKTEGPVNWELTRQLAQGIATGGEPEPNVDPTERIRMEELVRVADLHVADTTGLSTSTTGRLISVRAVGRAEWSWHTLEAWQHHIELLVTSLTGSRPARDLDEDHGDLPGPTYLDHPEDLGDVEGNLGDLLGKWASAMGPTLAGLQFGSTVGHLAQRAFGQYDLPIPRPASDELLVVPRNITQFAGDWSLPTDDVRLWVCLTEIVHHAVIGRPHVRARLEELIESYVSGFNPDAFSLEQRLADIDPADPHSVQRALGNPSSLIGEMQTATQRELLSQLDALTAAIEGYVDHVVDTVGRRLIRSFAPLAEALRRRRVERGEGERFVERLFGLGLDQDQFDRGARFVQGVIERAGEDGLAKLWSSGANLPTAPEVEAPGLWLERISFSR